MIQTEIKEQVKILVQQSPDGISLTKLHNRFQRNLTRIKLRALLGSLYKNEEISRMRMLPPYRRETLYFPFNGQPPLKRSRKKARERDKKMLSMKDFMPGKKYEAYIQP